VRTDSAAERHRINEIQERRRGSLFAFPALMESIGFANDNPGNEESECSAIRLNRPTGDRYLRQTHDSSIHLTLRLVLPGSTEQPAP